MQYIVCSNAGHIHMNRPHWIEFLEKMLRHHKHRIFLEENIFALLSSLAMLGIICLLIIINLAIDIPIRWFAGGWSVRSMGRLIDL